jgi:thiamine biosynthesis lipoprotein
VRRLIALGLPIVALAGAPGPELQRYESVEPHMGTLVRITVYTPTPEAATAAFRAAFDRIRALDDVLSDYKAESELNAVVKLAVGRDQRISWDLFDVLAASQAMAEATGGAFDITQGPVIALWREARRTGRVPDADALREAGERTGYRRLHLDPARRTVRLDTAGMALDVGAIGKGHAASEALATLRAAGVPHALVAVSGDLAIGDPPPGKKGWRVGLQTGETVPANLPAFLELANVAVSTSGSSEQHLDAGGRRYSHVIDPSTGMGLERDMAVTVIASTGMEADALDTAVSVLGVDKGLALIESRPDAAALIVVGDAAKASSRFARLLAPGASDRRPAS